MAIDFLRETYARQYKKDITGIQTATRNYLVKFDTDYTTIDTMVSAAVAGGLPDLGDAYSGSSSNLLAFEHIPNELDRELNFYSITVNYKSNNTTFLPPTQQDWRMQINTIKRQEVLDVTKSDTTGVWPGGQIHGVDIANPVLNTAGYPFDPTVTTTRVLTKITLTKNITSFTALGTITDLDDLISRVDTVNSDTLTIAGITGTAYQFYFEDVQISNQTIGDDDFYAINISIVYDPQLHMQYILNAGFIDANGPITINGVEPQLPIPLDINGVQIAPANRVVNSIYLAFGDKDQTVFADLGLPTSV